MFFQKNEKSSMETEIFEQPQIIEHLIKTYIDANNDINIDVPKDIEKIVFVASGSSYNSARFAADLFGDIASIEARAMYSSEFLLKSAVPHDKNLLYVFITQSGETSDTNKALARAKKFGVLTLCVTNKVNSTIWQASDYKMDCHAGEEKSIAATKSFTAQMFCLTVLALKYACLKGIDIKHYVDEIKSIPENMQNAFEILPEIKVFAKFITKFKNVIVTADGISYSLAREEALKIKETSFLNVSANILGEFMHGHVAVLNNKAVLIYLTINNLGFTAIKNLNKIKNDYNPPICIIGNPNDKVDANFELNINCESEIVKAFVISVIIQLLALESAKFLNRNVDKPHGLNKVVV